MTGQNQYNAATPYSGLVLTIADILSPVVMLMVNSMIALTQLLKRSRKAPAALTSTGPAPHVAMVMVPGNFVTSPFRNH